MVGGRAALGWLACHEELENSLKGTANRRYEKAMLFAMRIVVGRISE
jgi:hypothetical protein